MRRTRLFLLVFAIILLIVSAGFTFLLTLDLNDYKDNIERYVVRKTGRVFVIEGRIDLDLGGLTGLTVTDARLGNPAWAAHEDMARVGRASITLNLRSLWSGPAIIELVELDNAELNLEQRETGENNWTFGDGNEETGGGLMSLVLRQAHVANFSLTVTTPALDQPLEMRINRLDQVQTSDGLFDAKLLGTLNGRAINITGEYGPWESLLTATDLSFDIAGQFDTLSIIAEGLIDDLVRPRRPRVSIEITGPDIDHVTGMFGLPDLGSGNLDLKISLQPGAQDVAISVAGRVGEHQVESDGSVSDLIAFERVSMRVSVQGPELEKAARLFGLPQVPAGPYQLSGSVTRDGPRLVLDEIHLDIGSAKLRLDGLLKQFPKFRDATLSLEVRGEHVGRFTRLFGLPGIAEGPFSVTGELAVDPDGSEVVRLDVATQIAELKMVGTIGDGLNLVGSRAKVTGSGDDIAAIGAVLGFPVLIAGPFVFAGDIEFEQDVLRLPGDMTFTVGTNQLIATGVIGFKPLGDDTDIRAHIKGSDLAQAGLLVGITEGLPSVDYEASGRFQTPPEGYRISDLEARIGSAKLSVDGLLSDRENFIGTRIKIAASGPELGKFIADTGTMVFADGPFDVSGDIELLDNAVRLTGIDLKLAGATGTINADIGLPLAAASGTFDVLASGTSFSAVLSGSGSWEPPDESFEIRAQGKLDDGLVHVEPITIRLGNAHISAAGVFDIPPGLSRTSLKLEARVPNLETIGRFDGRMLADADFSLDAKFAGTPQSFTIDDLVMKSGASDLTGRIVVDLGREIPEMNLKLQSKLLDVTPFLEIESESGEETDGLDDDEGQSSTEDERIIPDWTLPLEQLANFNANIEIDIAKYRQNLREVDNLILDVTVRDGQLDVERASGATLYGSLSAMFRITPIDDSAMIYARFEGEQLVFGDTEGRLREDLDDAPRYDVFFILDGSGLTVRDIAASLNGQVRVDSAGGRTSNTALRFIYGNFLEELFTAVNPFVKTDPYSELLCVTLVADIENGMIKAKPGLAMQTDKMNIVSEGTIDLRTEKLDINFKTAPRKKISISAGEFINPYLKVAGTLANPHLTLDPTGTLVSGGAAIVTLGLSILAKAVWDRTFSAADPCAEVARQAEKNRQKKKSKH